MLRLCGVFIPGVFLLWFQNGEVRGPRVSVGGTFKFWAARPWPLQAKAFLYLFTVVSEIKTFPAAKQRRGLN